MKSFNRISKILLVVNIIFNISDTFSMNTESRSNEICATLSISKFGDKSKPSHFTVPKFQNEPNREPFNKLLYPNSTIESIEVTNGCSLRVCRFSKNIQKCKDSKKLLPNFYNTTWDGLKNKITGFDCSCEVKDKCEQSCENQTIPDTNKRHCASLFIDENCSDCKYNSIPLYVGDRYRSQNLSVISSIIVRENCSVTTKSKLTTDEPDEHVLTFRDPKLQEYFIQRYDFEFFHCTCDDYDPKDIPEPTESPRAGSIQTSLFIIIGVVTFLACLVSIMVVLKLIKRKHTSNRNHLYSALVSPRTKNLEETNLTALKINLNNVFQKKQATLIRRDDFEIDYSIGLGSGRFGKVYQGRMISENLFYAAKQIKTSIESDYISTLIREIEVLARIGVHPNVVQMKGYYISENNEMLLVLEYCEHNCLKTFLKKHKSKFIRNIARSGIPGYSAWDTVDENEENGEDENQIPDEVFELRKLVQWSYHIACGMEHISSLNILHLDIGVRNILLDKDFNAKVADLGLSKELNDALYYTKPPDKHPLPLAQMAPEVIGSYKFSINTDVWAFGICIWEIYSINQVPYSEISFIDELDFKRQIGEEGYRLPKPALCDEEIFKQIMACWNSEPVERPTFSDLKSFFESYLRSLDDKFISRL